jgi:hypothetical protein
MTQRKSRNVLPLADKIKIVDLLRKHTKPIGDGLIQYDAGWSDARIASSVGNHVSGPNHVQIIRVTQFGKFFHKASQSKSPEKSFTGDLIARIEKLESNMQKICDAFGLN